MSSFLQIDSKSTETTDFREELAVIFFLKRQEDLMFFFVCLFQIHIKKKMYDVEFLFKGIHFGSVYKGVSCPVML